jgi:hypothetical protein
VLLIWNPVSTEVTAETLGSVLVRLAGRLEVVAMHTRGPGDAGLAELERRRVLSCTRERDRQD